MDIIIKDATQNHFSAILAMNNSAGENITQLSMEQLDQLVNIAAIFKVAIYNNQLCGFIIGLSSNVTYNNLTFQWFKNKYAKFIFIERAVVDVKHRRHGIGRILYAEMESFAEQNAPYLTCSITIQPKNDTLMLFHGLLGFNEVGQMDGHEKIHGLLAKELEDYQFIKKHYLP